MKLLASALDRFLPLLQIVFNMLFFTQGFGFPIDSQRAWIIYSIFSVVVAAATAASWAGGWGRGGGCCTTSLSNGASPSSITKKLIFATWKFVPGNSGCVHLLLEASLWWQLKTYLHSPVIVELFNQSWLKPASPYFLPKGADGWKNLIPSDPFGPTLPCFYLPAIINFLMIGWKCDKFYMGEYMIKMSNVFIIQNQQILSEKIQKIWWLLTKFFCTLSKNLTMVIGSQAN